MIEHFSHGYITLAIAIGVSIAGSAIGLLLTRRARQIEPHQRRISSLVGAAFAIGGTGIWVMHFVAMLGFSVVDGTVRYDTLLTALSAVIAIVVVGCGLLIIGLGRYSAVKLAFAALFTGLGVAAMHYTGMAAVVASVELRHERAYVAAAVAIAIGASWVALWLAWRLEQAASIWLAGGVMALAVNAMHYTAMMGVRAGGPNDGPVVGVESFHLIFPMAVLTVIVMLVLIYVVATEPPLDYETEPAFPDPRRSAERFRTDSPSRR